MQKYMDNILTKTDFQAKLLEDSRIMLLHYVLLDWLFTQKSFAKIIG